MQLTHAINHHTCTQKTDQLPCGAGSLQQPSYLLNFDSVIYYAQSMWADSEAETGARASRKSGGAETENDGARGRGAELEG